jgi:hypothetical protein
MANRKLSLPLFSAKTLVSQPGCSTHYFHFIATVLAVPKSARSR